MYGEMKDNRDSSREGWGKAAREAMWEEQGP